MALDGVFRQIEADFLRPASPIRYGLSGYGSPVRLTGIGVMDDGWGNEYIEIRIGQHVDVRALATDVSHRYGLPVEVVRVVQAPAAQAHYYDLRAGDAVGHAGCSCRGTLGAFLVSREGGRHFLLSNAHVLALDGYARQGDWIVDQQGVGIARLMVSSRFVNGRYHEIDAAVAVLVDGVRPVASSYVTPVAASLGESVWKEGVTTGRTVGRVASVNYSISVRMRTGTIWFRNQLVVEPDNASCFSAPGDSGSVVRKLETAEDTCGLVFAGDSSGPLPHRTYANHFEAIIRQLRLNAG